MHHLLVFHQNVILKKRKYSGKFKKTCICHNQSISNFCRSSRKKCPRTYIRCLTTRRWKFTAFINQEKFPSCKLCYNKRLKRYIDVKREHSHSKANVCRWCCDWSFASRSRFINMKIPEKYPRTNSSHHLIRKCFAKCQTCSIWFQLNKTFHGWNKVVSFVFTMTIFNFGI